MYTHAAIPFGHAFERTVHFKEDDVLSSALGRGSTDSSSDDEGTSEADLTKALFDENYYDLLGLGEYGCSANDDQIRKACE